MTGISRRQLLQQSVALAGLSALPATGLWAQQTRGAFASAFSGADDRHFVGILDASGALLHRHRVPSRGHAPCVSRDGRLAAFCARRPGRWLVVIDQATGELSARVDAPKGRHFYGHGVFSGDNRYFYTTENDFQNNRGVIGVYDVTNGFRRMDELPSFGVGPHELRLLSDDNTLVVAVGGIETHPDYGRRKLNRETMTPSLTYIDLKAASRIAAYPPPHHQLSLRHLAVHDDDTVVVGAQYQGYARDDRPLVFTHRGETTLQTMNEQPLESQRTLKQYIASVAFADAGRIVVTSAPRGNRLVVWRADQKRWLRDVEVTDIGGVAPDATGRQLVLTSGNGTLYRLEPYSGKVSPLHQHAQLRWDNHLMAL